MQKRPPSLAQIALMVVFALSCVLILTYIWKSFGGPSPLAAKSYRMTARFDEATQLSDTAQVRISGVNVGRVITSKETEGRTSAEIEIESRYAPVPRDTRAILRQKTLLGETYVELTPGSRRSGPLPDGGTLPNAQIAPTTELDEITRALDVRTRRDLQRFVKAVGQGVRGRGGDLNAALGNLAPFATDSSKLLRVLDSQHRAVRRLVRDSGEVFGALGRRQGQLSGLVRAGDRVLRTTAARDRDLAETIRILPTTLAELRPTLRDLRLLSIEAAPVVRELRPGARALGPALRDTSVLAPQLEALFRDVDRLVTASKKGLPATTRVVHSARPLFKILVPTLRNAQPVVDFLGLYKREFVSSIAGVAAAFQGSEAQSAGGPRLHYLRAITPFTSEAGVAQAERFGTNRHNPYPVPGRLSSIEDVLPAYDCTNTGGRPTADMPPPCVAQQPLTFRGRSTAFPRIRADR